MNVCEACNTCMNVQTFCGGTGIKPQRPSGELRQMCQRLVEQHSKAKNTHSTESTVLVQESLIWSKFSCGNARNI